MNFDQLTVSINHANSLMNVTLDSNLSDFLIENGSNVVFSTDGRYDLAYEVKKV